MKLQFKKKDTRYASMLILICLLFTIIGCSVNSNDIPKNSPIEYLNESELSINGVGLDITRETLKSIVGEPIEINTDEWPHENWIYENVQYSFVFDDTGLYSIWISGLVQDSPRNIQVGDKFEDVLSNFPQEREYIHDSQAVEWYFYGEDFEYDSGYVRFYEEDASRKDMYLTIENGPFMKICFYEDKVISFSFGHPW